MLPALRFNKLYKRRKNMLARIWKKIGLIILISHYMSSVIIGLFNKKNDFSIDI